MGRIKHYTNLKLRAGQYQNPEGGATGPQNLTAATSYYTSAVPCDGAQQVVFRFRSTDANNAGSFGGTLDNDPTCVTALGIGGSTGATLVNAGANKMNSVGGLSVIVRPSSGSMAHKFVQGLITAGASGHTAVVVDADVYYDIEADVVLADAQQSGLSVPA